MQRLTLIFFSLVFPLSLLGQFHLGSIEDLVFYSPALNKQARMRVYLPPSYDPENQAKQYPVVISLHGASVGYEVYEFIYPLVDALWINERIDHFILVMPDGSAPPFNGSFYTNSTLYGNYEDMIAKDIIPFIDSAYNTIGSREFRAIMGHSMGSYGAFKQILKHPELYCAVAGHSGPVNIEKLDMLLPDVMAENGDPPYNWEYTPGKGHTNLFFTMSGAFTPNPQSDNLVDFPIDHKGELIDTVLSRWNQHNIVEMVRWHMPQSDVKIYFDCGSRDEYQLYFHNRALSDTLNKLGIRHQYTEYYGDHTSGLPLRVPLAFLFTDEVFKRNQAKAWDLQVPRHEQVKVYPNPARDLVFFETENLDQLESISIHRLDAAHIQTVPSIQNPLNISHLDQGVYTILFNFPQSRTMIKIVKID